MLSSCRALRLPVTTHFLMSSSCCFVASGGTTEARDDDSTTASGCGLPTVTFWGTAARGARGRRRRSPHEYMRGVRIPPSPAETVRQPPLTVGRVELALPDLLHLVPLELSHVRGGGDLGGGSAGVTAGRRGWGSSGARAPRLGCSCSSGRADAAVRPSAAGDGQAGSRHVRWGETKQNYMRDPRTPHHCRRVPHLREWSTVRSRMRSRFSGVLGMSPTRRPGSAGGASGS